MRPAFDLGANRGQRTQAEADAVNLKDSAITKIGQFIAQQAAKKADQAAKDGPDKGDGGNETPKFKPPRVILPKTLTTKSYLESKEDIDEFLKKLRSELEAAINNDERIEIR